MFRNSSALRRYSGLMWGREGPAAEYASPEPDRNTGKRFSTSIVISHGQKKKIKRNKDCPLPHTSAGSLKRSWRALSLTRLAALELRPPCARQGTTLKAAALPTAIGSDHIDRLYLPMRHVASRALLRGLSARGSSCAKPVHQSGPVLNLWIQAAPGFRAG
jgi:hypothetical protein